MDQFYFLLLIGLIALVRWLFSEGGLRKILSKLDDDLNNEADPQVRPPSASIPRRVAPGSAAVGRLESAEEKRLRKFREALGLPSGEKLVPPIIARVNPPYQRPVDRSRTRREPAGRAGPPRLPEIPKREISRQPAAADEEGNRSVEEYFKLETFDTPSIQVATPKMEPAFSASAAVPIQKAVVMESPLQQLFGNKSDLRRMVLAQEILGSPKSLQTF